MDASVQSERLPDGRINSGGVVEGDDLLVYSPGDYNDYAVYIDNVARIVWSGNNTAAADKRLEVVLSRFPGSYDAREYALVFDPTRNEFESTLRDIHGDKVAVREVSLKSC